MRPGRSGADLAHPGTVTAPDQDGVFPVPAPRTLASATSPEERRRGIAAAAVLLVVMAGHAMRETARDTLFLSSLPAATLPWTYLTIALLALAAGLAGSPLRARVSHRTALVATLLVGAGVDLAFWWFSRGDSAGTLLALYVWTGLLATAVTAQFWLHMADVFHLAEAKRLFPWIAAGGLGGAVLGAALASVVVLFLPVRALLLGSSALFAAGALLPWRLRARSDGVAVPAGSDAGAAGLPGGGVRVLLASPYLGRVVTLVALMAVLGTGVDFLFKTVVAAEIPRARLGDFFARFATTVNLGALLFQVFAAPLLLQGLGVIRTVAVLPTLLLLGAGSAAALGGLVPFLLLRGVDGMLRHSLHRAGTEILNFPVDTGLRTSFKTVVDALGHRGGQALASLAILLAVAWQAQPREIAAGLAVVAVVALLCLVGLRREYVARFRAQLRSLDPETRVSAPPLDLHSLETLVSSLSSPVDTEVVSALDLLEAYDRTPLVTPLILYHPSRTVVLRALDLLAGSDHPHLDAAIEQLLSHRDPEVRAAALRGHTARAPEGAAEILRALRGDPSHAVRLAARVAWLGRQADASELERLVGQVLAEGDRDARIALAGSLPQLPYPRIAGAVRALIAHRDPALAGALARAAAADATPRQLPLLIALLGRRESRVAARPLLLAFGDTSSIALARAQRSPDTPDAVRAQLCRTIALLASPLAVPPLVEALASGSSRVRFRALRGLGRLRAHAPALPVPTAPLRELARESLERAITLLYYRAVHEIRRDLHPPAPTPDPDADLLPRLLAEKIERSLERVFRALHILEPEHEYGVLFRALRRGGAQRAGSRELLEHLVEDPLRDGLLALLDPAEPVEQLRAAAACFEPEGAARLLALLPRNAQGKDLGEDARESLEALAREVAARLQHDRDPILASVARRHHAKPAQGPGAAEAIADGE